MANEQICYYCKHRGWTCYENSGDGVKHYCHCELDGIRREEFSECCDKWEKTERFKENLVSEEDNFESRR